MVTVYHVKIQTAAYLGSYGNICMAFHSRTEVRRASSHFSDIYIFSYLSDFLQLYVCLTDRCFEVFSCCTRCTIDVFQGCLPRRRQARASWTEHLHAFISIPFPHLANAAASHISLFVWSHLLSESIDTFVQLSGRDQHGCCEASMLMPLRAARGALPSQLPGCQC